MVVFRKDVCLKSYFYKINSFPNSLGVQLSSKKNVRSGASSYWLAVFVIIFFIDVIQLNRGTFILSFV